MPNTPSKPLIGELTEEINLTVSNKYVKKQIEEYRADHQVKLKQVIDGNETWEEGVGAYITLRAYEGSNEKAGTMFISQDIEWPDEIDLRH
jgi:hypothetical protein